MFLASILDGFGRSLRGLPRMAPPGWLRLSTGRADVQSDRMAVAEQTARGLLCETLGISVDEFARREYVDVPSGLFGGLIYRVRARQPVEVYEGDSPNPVGRLCAVVRASVPAADEVLTKALWLHTDEIQFLKTAQRME